MAADPKMVQDLYEAHRQRNETRIRELADMGGCVEVQPLDTSWTIGEYLENMAHTFPEWKLEARTFAGESSVALETVRRAAHAGPLRHAQGEIPATGRAVELPMMEVWELKEGKLASARIYFDRDALWRQLGLEERSLPPAALAEEHVVLVPGFFGFGTFGTRPSARIAYFDKATEDLGAARQELRNRIHVHEPLPTGSLESRVKSLFHKVLGVIGEECLLGCSRPKFVHLVGHSTGGVDAWLLTNDRYRWSDMTPEEERLRRRMLARIGTVATVSAPLYGTPISRGLGRVFRAFLDFLVMTEVLQRSGRRWRRARDSLAAVLSASNLFVPFLGANRPVLRLAGGLDADTAQQFALFRSLLLGDDRLIEDLRPENMERLAARIAGGEFPRMRHYVTVAPRPVLCPQAIDRRLTYAIGYWATADSGFLPVKLPEGTWFIESSEYPGLEASPRANDGVVPSSSQALLRDAAGGPDSRVKLVVGDHLDVVGHFEGKENATPFKSGATFTRDKHRQLWTDIARALETPTSRA